MPLQITGRLRGTNSHGTGPWTDEFVLSSFTLGDVLHQVCQVGELLEAGLQAAIEKQLAEDRRLEEEARKAIEAAAAPQVMLDENGNPMLDEFGNPVLFASIFKNHG